MTKQFGIIGYPLEHSFSANYFNKKFAEEGIDAHYHLFPLKDIKDFIHLRASHDFVGCNVTYPYKENIIPYLDGLDHTAAAIGAVNVIAWNEGKLIGYNTDAIGFMYSCPKGYKQALILGTGGAAKAAAYALQQLGITYHFVSRDKNKGLLYDTLDATIMQAHPLIINCTPLGMFPNIDACPPIPYELLSSNHFLYDVIYNPAQTHFLALGEEYGTKTQNGLKMLYGQAESAWNIWKNNI